jgi:hypothetical protein
MVFMKKDDGKTVLVIARPVTNNFTKHPELKEDEVFIGNIPRKKLPEGSPYRFGDIAYDISGAKLVAVVGKSAMIIGPLFAKKSAVDRLTQAALN